MTRHELSDIYSPNTFGVHVCFEELADFLNSLEGDDLHWMGPGRRSPTDIPDERLRDFRVSNQLGEPMCVVFFPSSEMATYPVQNVIGAGISVFEILHDIQPFCDLGKPIPKETLMLIISCED